MSDKSVCDYVGVAYSAFRKWRDEDEAFAAEVTRARARWERAACEKIQRAQDWRAIAYLLAVRYPEHYSERKIIETNTPCPLDAVFGTRVAEDEDDSEES